MMPYDQLRCIRLMRSYGYVSEYVLFVYFDPNHQDRENPLGKLNFSLHYKVRIFVKFEFAKFN